MTNAIAIPLNKLLAWDGNIRRTDPDKGIDELAASITAHGLLQSLVVRKDKRGKYAVVAGRRRLHALKALAEIGTIAIQKSIPCHVLDTETDATEISLAENVQREAMHPADEFEAFNALIERGMPVADVAARFGVTETVVQKRLKLANVSPTLLQAYRDGEMTLQHVMAFAVTEDHATQERIWNDLSHWQKNDPDTIRDLLTEGEVTARDRRVTFVTLKAYEKAGGTVRRDLFGEGADGVFIQDLALLESLVAKKLERTAGAVRKQGWKWVEVHPSFDHSAWSACERRYPELVPLPPEQQEEFDRLTAEAEALSQCDNLGDDQQARLDAIQDRLDELEDRETAWSAETLAIAVAVITLGYDGKADIHHGYIKPEDAPAKTRARTQKSSAVDDTADKCALSASLVESLTAHRSAALSALLMKRPDIALAGTVHALAVPVFYGGARGDTPLQISVQLASLHRVDGSSAARLISGEAEDWAERLPCNPDGLFAWCLGQTAETLGALLAFCVARTLSAVQLKADHPASPRLKHANMFAEALSLDMLSWFTPTAANYFSRISKAGIIEALREVKGATAPAWSAMKKTDLAAFAERQIAGTSWLPELLRPSQPDATELSDAVQDIGGDDTRVGRCHAGEVAA